MEAKKTIYYVKERTVIILSALWIVIGIASGIVLYQNGIRVIQEKAQGASRIEEKHEEKPLPVSDCDEYIREQLMNESIRLTKIFTGLGREFNTLPDSAVTRRKELIELSNEAAAKHNEVTYLFTEIFKKK